MMAATTPGEPLATRQPPTAPPDPADVRPDADAVWRELREAASRPYRRAGRFAWHFARGKLRHDPVFRHLVETGRVPPGARVLDLGCGQGLLASLLLACEMRAACGDWPAGWAPPPRGVRVVGLELDRRDAARARAALGEPAPEASDARFRVLQGDMRTTPFEPAEVVVALDVLHYVAPHEQDALLARVRAALAPGGRLLLRVGDGAARRGLGATRWLDRLGSLVRGAAVAPQAVRSVAAWRERLEALGFAVEAVPMSRGTPFANVLLVAEVPR